MVVQGVNKNRDRWAVIIRDEKRGASRRVRNAEMLPRMPARQAKMPTAPTRVQKAIWLDVGRLQSSICRSEDDDPCRQPEVPSLLSSMAKHVKPAIANPSVNRRYFSRLSSTTITSIGFSPAFTSACLVCGGFAGSQ